MNTINLNEYMNSVYSEWNSSNEPILAALGKKGAPRIDFGNRIYGAKGIKRTLFSGIFLKISEPSICKLLKLL